MPRRDASSGLLDLEAEEPHADLPRLECRDRLPRPPAATLTSRVRCVRRSESQASPLTESKLRRDARGIDRSQ